jgi:hypothetical protein
MTDECKVIRYWLEKDQQPSHEVDGTTKLEQKYKEQDRKVEGKWNESHDHASEMTIYFHSLLSQWVFKVIYLLPRKLHDWTKKWQTKGDTIEAYQSVHGVLLLE